MSGVHKQIDEEIREALFSFTSFPINVNEFNLIWVEIFYLNLSNAREFLLYFDSINLMIYKARYVH